MDQGIFAEVREVIAEQLAVEASAVTPEASFEHDLQADSLAFVELLMALEDKLGIQDVPEEDASRLKTVGDLIRYVESHRRGR